MTTIQRYQRGFVRQRGKHKVWYGTYRGEPDSNGIRPQFQVRLGTFAELPTKNAARAKLAELMSSNSAHPAAKDITFSALTQRWEKAEGPAMKESTLAHYLHSLRVVMPTFGAIPLRMISRESVQTFLNEKALTYSKSSLRSMRAVLGLTLGWANANGWIDRNPCVKIKLPKQTGGRKVVRTVFTPAQVWAITDQLNDPYATLVLLLSVTGLRISEAIALKWSDLRGNVLYVSRRIYDRKEDAVKSIKSVRELPLSVEMIERLDHLRSLFPNREWLFTSEAGTPIDPHNALVRYLRPAARTLGLSIGGWHDFRHTLSTGLRRAGVHPKVVSDILGHSRVDLAMNVYDRTDVNDKQPALLAVSKQTVTAWSDYEWRRREAFEDRYLVDESSGCWVWTEGKDVVGRGKFRFNGEVLPARVSHILHKGPIPTDKIVCHTCDNHSCVNPEHLFLCTYKENVQDMVQKGRAAWQKKDQTVVTNLLPKSLPA